MVWKQLKFHKELYGESVLQPKNSAANCIIESSEVLRLQELNTQVKQQQREADVAATSKKQQHREADVEATSKPQQVLPPTAADSNSSISPVSRSVKFHFLN